MTTHIVRPGAEAEIVHALDYFALHAPGKVIALEEAIDEVIGRITADPNRYRPRVDDIRCAFIRGFPYQVWYIWRDDLDVVDIIAFLHGRQDRGHLITQRGTR